MLIRFFDVLLSLTALIILLPLMVPVMIALKLTGEHDIFYFQARAGFGGKDFRVIKFVTMLKGSAEMAGGVLTQKNDPRILPMGKFLRKTKINELPQILNILFGQMSFVGPRPQARRHYDLYSEAVKKEIDKLRPGLTGIGSVVFRDEEEILDRVEGNRDNFHDTVIAPYKGELEVWYAKNRNLRNYFALILLTGWVVLRSKSRVYIRLFHNLPPVPGELKPYLQA